MTDGITQEGRFLRMRTSLGKDVLLLERLSGSEGLSRLFEFDLELLSPEDSIAPRDIVGKPVSFCIHPEGERPRHFHGVVSVFAACAQEPAALRRYRARVVPALWFLTRTEDCRIFQDKGVVEIVETLLREHGVDDFETNRVTGNHPVAPYRVQYRESAFAFVSRLLEEEGIHYTFRHEEGRHVLVLSDATAGYVDCAESKVVQTSGSRVEPHVAGWQREHRFISGSWACKDFSFESPKAPLQASAKTIVELPAARDYERFEYPGGHATQGDGEGRTQLRMEAEEASFDVAHGTSTCRSFTPGGKFGFDEHESQEELGQRYVLLSVEHVAREASYHEAGKELPYENRFRCMPADRVYRPPRTSPRAVVAGPQTAMVVGPAGEEIYTDRHGRIKVQFHWDRVGSRDEGSSCWIRVAQQWAGKQWGALFLPRIGQEVVVEFLEGDPDRPLVTGSVYNADLPPPWELPARRTESGWKTRSSKEGSTATCNELRFEDKNGEELIHVHAERDHERVVEHDDRLEVQGKRTVEVERDHAETVKSGHRSVTVESGDERHLVELGDSELTVSMGGRRERIDRGDLEIELGLGDHKLQLTAGKSTTSALQSIELKVGANSIKVDQTGITLKGILVQVEGSAMAQVSAPMATVKGDGMLNLDGGITMIG